MSCILQDIGDQLGCLNENLVLMVKVGLIPDQSRCKKARILTVFEGSPFSLVKNFSIISAKILPSIDFLTGLA